MNRELKKRWVEALRSGQYKQGQKQLRPDADTFCCLGVLCDLLDANGWKNLGSHTHEPRHSYGDFWPNQGFPVTDIIPRDLAAELAKYNDNGLMDFSMLADKIQQIVPEDDEPIPLPSELGSPSQEKTTNT